MCRRSEVLLRARPPETVLALRRAKYSEIERDDGFVWRSFTACHNYKMGDIKREEFGKRTSANRADSPNCWAAMGGCGTGDKEEVIDAISEVSEVS